jgi:hypothetical protein
LENVFTIADGNVSPVGPAKFSPKGVRIV